MNNLKDFIDILEKENELIRIKKPVSKGLEITEITDRVCKSTPDKNKALLFEQVAGFDIPIATNLFGSEKRMALCFGSNNLEEIAKKITNLAYFLLIFGIGFEIYHLITKKIRFNRE